MTQATTPVVAPETTPVALAKALLTTPMASIMSKRECVQGGQLIWVEKEKLKLEKLFMVLQKENNYTGIKEDFLDQSKMFSV